MDKRIRLNEFCIIGLPRCDFAFSSTRNCFIAYGFKESKLETTILKRLLKDKEVEPIEAGGTTTPAQNAFCAKICSKIITSQFCVILLNNATKGKQEIPNANVNMEYGLMLGFNKYIIPFQRESQSLPFNVAGLDTIKYDDDNFEQKATHEIDQAIKKTQQEAPKQVGFDQILETFLLTKKALITNIQNEGDRNLYDLGRPLGFYLLNDFTGFTYMFLGYFPMLRIETILWRVRMLNQIHKERLASLPDRIGLGMINQELAPKVKSFLEKMQVWVVVTSTKDKNKLEQALKNSGITLTTEVFTLDEMKSEVMKKL